MQQQVMKRNMSSEFGWGSGAEGLGQKSGSWASTANIESSSSPSSSWQNIGKSDNSSDTGDDASSIKSGSTITNITPQSQDSTNTSNSGLLQTSSSSPWSSSNSTLSTMDSSPWGNSTSSAASIGSMGWTSNSSNLSLSNTNSQGHNNNLQQSSNMGINSAFTSSNSNSSTVWPTSITGNSLASTSNLPPNMSSRLQANSLSSQWQSSTMLGNIGDFSKASDSAWSLPTSSLTDNNKDLGGASSDPRMWALPSDKPSESQWDTSKSQWGNNTLAPIGADQGASNTELSFAQATLKGLKVVPPTNTPQPVVNSRQEEILRAIESHEGWGTRPIRQDTSWDVESSPKSHRKFSTDVSAGASNVWNSIIGTDKWESCRESSNAPGKVPGGNAYNVEKDLTSLVGPPKPAQDPNSWNVGGNTDPKTFGTWGVTNAAGDAPNKMWGQKTEVGSWGDSGAIQRTTSISSWGDDGDHQAGAWEDTRRLAAGVGGMQVIVPPSPGLGAPGNMLGIVPQGMSGMNTAVMSSEPAAWNEIQKPGWTSTNAAASLRTNFDEPWNKPPPTRTGWGDPAQEGAEANNGTSIWASNALKQLQIGIFIESSNRMAEPNLKKRKMDVEHHDGMTYLKRQMPKPAGWGDAGPQNQWPAAVGAKPKNPGMDEASWAMAQRVKSERYPDEVSTNSVEVGFWNGLPQDNSTWNDPAALRGVRKITAQQVQPKYVSSGSNPPTQMRAKLLQHLMDMGFRKEEAQNALITNNLNLEMAINDLKAGNVSISRKDLDMDVFQANGSQPRMPYMTRGGLGGDDMSDMRPDQVPTFNNSQNTPFPNAQTLNQPFMQSNASVPPSSLNLSNSINNIGLQQKLMQKMQQQPAPPSLVQRGPIPPVGSGTNSQAPQQKQQIRSQVQQAINNGFISSQLLNYQLPHNILVLLQQLLQLQTALQNVVSTQQQMMQQARTTGNRSNSQLEQMPGIVSNINQQIISVQKQLQQAQNNFFSSQKPPNLSQTPSGVMTPQSSQQTGTNMVDSLDALSTYLANVALQSQSRLTTQWKPSGDTSSGIATDLASNTTISAINKANEETGDGKAPGTKSGLQTLSSPNLNLIPGGLGMTGDKTWSSNMSTTSSSNWPPSSNDSTAKNSQADIKVSNSTSTSTSLLAGLQSGFTDVIPEFVPGKPWQGLAKNVEDDPHVTPGSIQLQRSLSVNRVHDDSLNNLDGHKLSNSSWGMGLKSDNSLGLSQLGNHPPPSMSSLNKGIGGQQQWQSGGNFNRQTSWPHSTNSAFTKVTGSGWNDSTGAISSWILLKNLTVDPNTVRALCAQHGNLISFYPLAQGQLALVQYSSRDIAYWAQQHLNNFQMGSAMITAEFFGETDAQRVTSQIPPPQPSALPQMNASPWSQAPPSTPLQNTSARGGDPWSSSMMSQPSSKFGSVKENWNLWDRPDHNFNPLGNILGGESM